MDNEKVKEQMPKLLESLKDIGIKQFEVAKRLGVTEAAVSGWRTGRRNISESTLKSICRECWNGKYIDYIWLTTGEGEMFRDSDIDFYEKIDRIMAGENDTLKNLIKKLVDASDEDIAALQKYIDFCATLKKES